MFSLELLKQIGADIRRHWWLLVLASMVVISAALVILAARDARVLTAHYNNLLQQRDAADTDWRHLLLEEQTLAEHSRIEAIARKQLQMERPKPAQEQVVRIP